MAKLVQILKTANTCTKNFCSQFLIPINLWKIQPIFNRELKFAKYATDEGIIRYG
jgi:hypothetical protein